MRAELLVDTDCPACDKAQTVWRAVCRQRGVNLRTLYVDSDDGRDRQRGWRLATIPAVFIDDQLMAVGVQSPEQAIELLDIAQTR